MITHCATRFFYQASKNTKLLKNNHLQLNHENLNRFIVILTILNT
jgi:hypothetical protein